VTEDRDHRRRPEYRWRILLLGPIIALVVALVLVALYWQFAVHPNLWDFVTNGADL
jgi:hypothetical protein